MKGTRERLAQKLVMSCRADIWLFGGAMPEAAAHSKTEYARESWKG